MKAMRMRKRNCIEPVQSLASAACLSGTIVGFVYMSFVRGSIKVAFDTMFTSITGFITTLGVLAVWMIMYTVIYMLIKQARLFARLGKHNTRVSLLDAYNLRPLSVFLLTPVSLLLVRWLYSHC
jgi:hypothetical protein